MAGRLFFWGGGVYFPVALKFSGPLGYILIIFMEPCYLSVAALGRLLPDFDGVNERSTLKVE